MKFLTAKQKDIIREIMNPEGSNFKDCNFFRVESENDKGYRLEVGYWITYIGCKPRYRKEQVFVTKKELENIE